MLARGFARAVRGCGADTAAITAFTRFVGAAAAAAARVQPQAEASTSAAAVGAVFGAAVIERLPIVMPRAPAWEAEYQAWSEQRRLSFYKPPLKLFSKPPGSADEEGDAPAHGWTPLEVPDVPEPDLRLPTRAARECVYLLVKSAAGGWGFPRAAHQPGESIRQTAERAAAETVPPESLELYFVGNAPIAHFSAPAKGGALETTWMLRASVLGLDGGVRLAKGFSDFAWLTKAELQQHFPAEVHQLLQDALA